MNYIASCIGGPCDRKEVELQLTAQGNWPDTIQVKPRRGKPVTYCICTGLSPHGRGDNYIQFYEFDEE